MPTKTVVIEVTAVFESDSDAGAFAIAATKTIVTSMLHNELLRESDMNIHVKTSLDGNPVCEYQPEAKPSNDDEQERSE